MEQVVFDGSDGRLNRHALQTRASRGGAGVTASTVRSNLMDSDKNSDDSNKSHTGKDLTPGQLSKIDNTIAGQQPKQ